ncbi:MAG: 5-(carboxyamino)imidazole ribonucleotide synthase [Myxococcales bacterium]|jgi:5-(carboxyamino)imidazole ribonucleotide synthase|nr:5-(carboxyamino)imidazole ribonucleotide synthase [Myxococcales bacterium]
MKVGILGAGQLGRMLALAAHPLGIETLLVDPDAESPAAQVSEVLVAPYTDPAALERLAQCDVVTFEFENVPESAASQLAATCEVYPPPEALRVAQDRWLEKSCFRELGIDTPRFFQVDSLDDLKTAAEALGHRLVLKTRRFGYDGKGQSVVTAPDQVAEAFAALRGAPAIAEELVPFDRELSVIACRDRDGHTMLYPPTENRHVGGVLRSSIAPAPNLSPAVRDAALRAAEALLHRFSYVGVLGLELFQVGDRVLANEFAPRVHNSGHWTIEGARTSQFENHVRAIAGLPLGSAAPLEWAGMLNLLGRIPDPKAILAVPDAHLHDYGKEPREGRKVGHVTVRASSEEELRERLAALEAILDGR